MKDTTVSSRYAHALMIVTERRGETARALQDLQALLVAMGPGTRAGAILSSPLVRLPDKRKVITQVLAGHVLSSVVVFVDLLLRKKRLGDFPVIVTEFEALVERAQGIQRAEVSSAVALTDGELERLHTALERWTRKHIKLQAQVDPSLVGGAMVRIGDRVIDRSVRTLLESISKQLHEASV